MNTTHEKSEKIPINKECNPQLLTQRDKRGELTSLYYIMHIPYI